MMKEFQPPRGMSDILPAEEKYWRFLERTVEKKCENFNFARIETPLIENKELFERSTGKETDIVSKEMYGVERFTKSPEELSENILALRPEATPGIVRAFLNYFQSEPLPIKLWYWGPMFRAERPQAGRKRQFYQFGFEILGDESSLSDVLVVFLSLQILEKIGLKNIIVEINSLGCKICRNKITKTLTKFFNKNKKDFCPTCRERIKKNPLRIYDCKELSCQQIILNAPQLIDSLCKNCEADFRKILEYLDELNINYDINPRLVRGLDYYTRTVFEFRDPEDVNRQSALGGGGGYDNLAELLGGESTPAVGTAFGVERIIEKIKEKNINVPEIAKPKIFLIAIGEKAKSKVLEIMKLLALKNISQDNALGKQSLKAQLKMADKSEVKFALIIGQKEILENSVILRNLEEGTQETVSLNKLEKRFKKLF